MKKKYFTGAKIFITHEVIDYFKKYAADNFPPDIFDTDKIKVGDQWNVTDMFMSGGIVMLQISSGDSWIFVPAHLFYCEGYIDYLRTIC